MGAFGISIVIFAFLLPRAAYAQVIINEVMADPAATSDKSEWVELYNYSAQDVDLRGWSLDGKLVSAPSPVNIPAQGFYIVTKTAADFTQEFGPATNVLELGISLTNSGKTLDLTDGKGYKDSINYPAASPSISWERKGPLCADLLKHPTTNSLNAKNVAYVSQCYPQPLNITGIQFSTDNVNWVDGFAGLDQTQLYFRYSASGPAVVQSVQWTTWDDKALTNPANIDYYPAKPVKLTVHTDQGNFTANSASLIIMPRLIINEFMPNPDGDDSGQEWVEIYNPTDNAVSLQGAELRDASEQMLAFAVDAVVPAKGYVVATLPTSKLQNCQKPAVCHDEIDLYSGSLLIDKVTYDDSRSGQSWSLDDTGHWTLAWAVTPGQKNQALTSVPPTVQISEVFPSPQASKQEQEWLELYNWGNVAVDLTNWSIKDLSSSHKLTNLIISPGQYLVLTDIGVSLNNGGDDISLYGATGQLADEFKYTAADNSFAWMRVWTDNKYSADLKLTAQPSPGLRNVFLQDQASPATIQESAQCVPVVEDVTPQVAGITTSQLPSTDVHRLNGAAPTQTIPTVVVWPLFLIVIITSLLQIVGNGKVKTVFGGIIKWLLAQLNYLNHLPQVLAQWKSRLPWFAASPPT